MKFFPSIRMFAVAAVLSLLLGCSGNLKPHEVLVIKKTNMYHREGCPPTIMAKTTIMTAAEARAEKYKPCPICKPDSE
ncbi:MAG: hypothetical protein WBW71_13745 [Bacteroidota bacterium]